MSRAALARLRPRRPPEWPRVVRILAGAFDVPPLERQAYLDRACAGDPALRAEVSGLLAASDTEGLLDRPLDSLLSLLGSDDVMAADRPPRVVSHFELLSRISSGGMGVVYRARDIRLQRIVALKLLTVAMGADGRATSRFLLEARAAAALDHRNVCAVHEVGEPRPQGHRGTPTATGRSASPLAAARERRYQWSISAELTT